MARRAEAVLYLLVEQGGAFKQAAVKKCQNGRWVPQVDGDYTAKDYYLRYTLNGIRKWENVGPELGAAISERVARQTILDNGREQQPQTRSLLSTAITAYIVYERSVRGARSANRTRQLLELFNWKAKKTYLEEVTQETLKDFILYLAAERKSPKTIKDRISCIKTFLRRHGNDIEMAKSDLPKVTKRINDCYTEAEVVAMLAVADEDEAFLINFLIATGMREQEAAHTTWNDVKGTFVRVTAKPNCRCPHCKEEGFSIKDDEEREIPIDPKFQAIFEARRKTHGHQPLLFANGNGHPEGHILYTLKALGKRAGIKCENCKVVDATRSRRTSGAEHLRPGLQRFHEVDGVAHVAVHLYDHFVVGVLDPVCVDKIRHAKDDGGLFVLHRAASP
jgi:integrase